jgi:hypothetical protein
LGLILSLLGCAAIPAQEKVNQNAAVLQDFSRRVADYVKLRNAAKAEVHGLKQTSSPQAILDYEHRLAHRIREQREGVTQGNIFTSEIAAEFRRLIGTTMQSPDAARIRTTLQNGSPVRLNALRVDHTYPSDIPLQTTPPSLLMNLPPLPRELEYRVVGHELILRDVDANIIVDWVSNAIP